MKLLARLLALFLTLPVVELFLLLQVDRLIGLWWTLGIILMTGLLGSYLAKREGVLAWKRLNERLRSGGLPAKEALDGVIILIAGALLITPGVLTDFAGFAGLLPPSRALIRKLVMKRIKRWTKSEGAASFGIWGMDAGGWHEQAYDRASYESSPFEPPSEPDGDGAPRWEGQQRETPRHAAEDAGDPPGSLPEDRTPGPV